MSVVNVNEHDIVIKKRKSVGSLSSAMDMERHDAINVSANQINNESQSQAEIALNVNPSPPCHRRK